MMIKTGNYFLVYSGLSQSQVEKGKTIKQGDIIGTLAKGDDEVTYDLELMLVTKYKTLNINRWFN